MPKCAGLKVKYGFIDNMNVNVVCNSCQSLSELVFFMLLLQLESGYGLNLKIHMDSILVNPMITC